MEHALIMLSVVFIFFFGSVLTEKIFTLGFAVADKALESSGKLLKLPFVLTFKAIAFSAKFVIKQLKSNKHPEVIFRPIYDVTPKPLHLQAQGFDHRYIVQERNRISEDKNRIPLIIEHPQT